MSSVCPGMFGLVFGLSGMLMYDGERVTQSGMFQGYNTVTWAVVALQVISRCAGRIRYEVVCRGDG